MSFSLHSKHIQNNLNEIVKELIPNIDRSLVFISEEKLFDKFKTDNLYITRGLHYGSHDDAFHFNFKIVEYDTEFHVYVGLNYRSKSYPFMLLFLTDSSYSIPNLYEYLQYNNYDQYLLFNTLNNLDVNDDILIYEYMIKENQKLGFEVLEKEENKE